MKNIKIFCMLVVSALLLFSCFEDDGNYDYKDIYTHKIGIRYPVYGITVYQGDPVVFSPSFAFAESGTKGVPGIPICTNGLTISTIWDVCVPNGI